MIGIRPYDKTQDLNTIVARNGDLRGTITFPLFPPGPGPGLDVSADRVKLYEGEQVQLHVYKPSPNGSRHDVASTSTGTRYLSFPGYGKHDPSVINIDDDGVAHATASIGKLYNKRTVMIFARNSDRVGWIEMKVFPRSSRQ